jgi:hypothetical protein
VLPDPWRLLDRSTRRWVRATGRPVELPLGHWLDGPSGDRDEIGEAWVAREAARHRGRVVDAGPDAGLLPSMALLDGPGFDASALHPLVLDFYQRTARWRLELWSQWSAPARLGGRAVSALFARRLDQLSLPLRPLDLAHGMSSEVRPVVGADGATVGASWRRRLRATGATVYSGWYGTARLPGSPRPSVRVSFPLPDGRLVVLLRPAVTARGGLLLTSGPGRWGQDGAYLVVQPAGRAAGWARRIPVHERFHVHVDDEGVLRTDHDLRLGAVLRLHYRLDPAAAPRRPAPPG